MWRNVLFLPPAIWHQAGSDTDSEQLPSDTSSKYIHIVGKYLHIIYLIEETYKDKDSKFKWLTMLLKESITQSIR